MTLRVGAIKCRGLIVGLEGERAPQRFPMDVDDGEIIVGRVTSNTVVVPGVYVCRQHFRLLPTADGFAVEDLGSTGAGTQLNGLRALPPSRPAPLHVGDFVAFGGLYLCFEHWIDTEPDPDRARFLEEICRAPRDDAPRLVYADWLCERGDPLGEFIHYQVGLEHLPPDDARRDELAALAAELLVRHEREWIAPLPFPVSDWNFGRGLLSRVRLDAGALADDDPRLEEFLRRHPVCEVDFTWGTLTAEVRARLPRSALVKRILENGGLVQVAIR